MVLRKSGRVGSRRFGRVGSRRFLKREIVERQFLFFCICIDIYFPSRKGFSVAYREIIQGKAFISPVFFVFLPGIVQK